MKVRMLTGIAAHDYAYSPGAEVDVPDAEARRWISAGIAEPVRGARETATQPRYETATTVEPKHTGGGWYELPNGETVRGRDEAMKRMREL